MRQHGTASMYAYGCRCPDCVRANSASAWAKRKAKGWDGAIDMGAFYCAVDPVAVRIRGETVLVSPEAVRRAVAKFENTIKVEALAASRFHVEPAV